ncbi:MAG: metallophosphoesterase [Verrucomicrobia bacterium]|nr:metallophosphoesterase [Verrucomicrobiota bacterium]
MDHPLSIGSMSRLVVVIGDVHAEIALAVTALERLEIDLGRPIDQVFSIGDFGLFLDETDWDWLSGPRHHRHPEASPAIREAWHLWRWPLSCIGGNHEPFHKLRVFDSSAFGDKLIYTNAGILSHSIPNLRVAALSGIFHPDHLEFSSPQAVRTRSAPKPKTWSEMLELAHDGSLSLRRLTYYKASEIALVASTPPRPHLLLTHDWPAWPATATPLYEDRPERYLLDALSPKFHCCGHWHFASADQIEDTQVRALNIISRSKNFVEPGWARCFEWDGAELHDLAAFP